MRTGIICLILSLGLPAGLFAAPADDLLVELPWEKLSERDISDWGRLARQIEPAKWQQGETKHFIIHFTRSGQKVATRCEKLYAEIREFFGNPPDRLGGRKSHVFAFHEQKAWEAFVTSIGMQGVVGITRGQEFFFLTSTPGGRYDSEAKVQRHELTHLVFNRFFAGQPPLWLNEGIAEYFGQRETSTLTEFRRLMGQQRAFPLDDLFHTTAYPADPEARAAFYAEAAIVIDFLTRTEEGRQRLPKFVAAMIANNDLAAALRIYGFNDFADFRSKYQQYRRRF